MHVDILRILLLRDLGGVRREVEAYPDDALPWVQPPGLPNAGGTLVLHLCGNLRHFVGAQLGGSGYVRHRDAEFSRRDLTRAELLAAVDATVAEVDAALHAVADDALDAPYPLPIAGRTVRTRDLLAHVAVHLAYHLGQLDYHRRLVTGDVAGVGALAIGELPALGDAAAAPAGPAAAAAQPQRA